tara:strand:- start:8166 stop:10226 length:2061 start_codon:yes stop_codon:yes gene_type:complete
MPNLLIIDFETRSRVDLKTQGTDLYCTDPSTEVLCMAACFSDPEDDRTWLWYGYEKVLPLELFSILAEHINSGGLFAAHNARFDQQIWEYVATEDHGFPHVQVNSWYCTSAQARVNALPANLDDATRAINAKHRKNHTGGALIKKLCIPNKDTGQFYENRDDLHALGAYCVDDILATKALANACRLMSPTEHADWLANERINDRGLRIDRPLAEKATSFAAVEVAALGKELTALTGGEVTKHTQNARIKAWLLPRLSPEAEALTAVHTTDAAKNDVRKNSLAKNIRANLLGRADAGEIELEDVVYNVIAALDDGNKSSVSKFKRMVERADPDDDRVRGAFMYAGAATLRYTSRGLQLHNFRRDCWSPSETASFRGLMLAGQSLDEGTVMDTLSKLLRPALLPADGNVFVVNDWSSIESRALPWLADDPRAERKLETYRAYDDAPEDSKPLDAYQEAAADAGVLLRQVGKVIVLSLGFGGAEGAFNAMARNYGVFLPLQEVKEIVKNWRRKNAWAPDFWDALERAAITAVRNPLTECKAGRVTYIYVPDLMEGSLLCKLPGDHYITYPKARVELVETQFGAKRQLTALKANWTPKADDPEWPRFRLWRGLLAENVTQAFCAALLRWAVRETDSAVLHCHDEIGLEVPTEQAEATAMQLQELMESPPEWAQGLPLAAKPAIMTRYGKP